MNENKLEDKYESKTAQAPYTNMTATAPNNTGIPIISQLYGASEVYSIIAGKKHASGYLHQVSNIYMPEILDELKNMGEDELAESVKATSMFMPSYLLITRKLGKKIIEKLPAYKEAMKMYFNDKKLSDKSLDLVTMLAMGKQILDEYNPFGLNGIDFNQTIPYMTNPRNTIPNTPFINLTGITEDDMNKFKTEVSMEGYDPRLEQRLEHYENPMPRQRIEL